MTGEKSKPTTGPCSATEGDMQQTILGLRGIFAALNMLIRSRVADGAMSQEYIDSAVDELLVAGEQLADEIAGRF
jgi:hypothetical protein